MNEKLFKQVKALTDADISGSKIRLVTGKGLQVIRMVGQARDFEDYMKLMREFNLKYRSPKAASGSFFRRVFQSSDSSLEAEISKAQEALSNIQKLISER